MTNRKEKSKANVLIVDDNEQIVRTLDMALTSWAYDTLQAGTIAEAKLQIKTEEPQIVLLDIELPDGSGLDLLSEIKEQNPETIVVMVTGNVDVNTTIAALRGGAHDFVSKPIHLEELRVTLRNSVETRTLRREVKQMRRQRAEQFSFEEIIGESPSMGKAIETAKKVAASEVSSVLLQGETGTGKDLFARAIHFASERRKAPYLAINCAALPANLIESELFGYEKGAFTDAKKRKEGLFEQADGGTLFLDEIGEMDIALQAKLLRVLEEGKFRRIGGLKEIPIDVRVIAASNRDLKEESTQGNFRLDLYYRLAVIQIDIPPLRDRSSDILLLAKHYIDLTNQKKRGNSKLEGLSKPTEKIFKSYEWLGNVRELRNVIERASILEDGKLITTEYLPKDLVSGNGAEQTVSDFRLPPDGVALQDVELELVRQAVQRTGGNLTQAAKLLDISRDQVRYRLKRDGDGKKKSISAAQD
ncbi:MAG: sigma-54-dependent Fis family transcriptional regulator [Pyrinomonadaceae bacterium]|nr:sigma-54-dependent Fis family transcriptional regulator [Pyrinomonadaceae bacterium]